MRNQQSEFGGEIGIHYPLHVLNRYSLPELIDLADIACQTMGKFDFSQVWTNDNLEYRSVLATSAAIVARLPVKLGTAVTVPYFRNPIDLAMAFATISELTRGRELSLGLGPGSRSILAHQVNRVKPLAIMAELATALRKLFAGEPEQPAAEALAPRVKHIAEFVRQSPVGPSMAPPDALPRKVTYHSSCHLRAAGVTKEPRAILSSLPGLEYVEMPDADRCAGGAGTYLVKDFDTSQQIVARKRQAVEYSGADIVATSCPACMIQLKTGLPPTIGVKHIAEVLHDSYEAGARNAGEPPS